MYLHKEKRKMKTSLEEKNTDSVPLQFQDSYKEEAVEIGELVLPSGNTDELQVFSNEDSICKKHKKKKRHEREENSLTVLHNVEDNQGENVLQGVNTDALQVFSNEDSICKKHKKKKRHERDEHSLSVLHNVEVNQVESVLQGVNDDELQALPDKDSSICKKHKKRKRLENGESSLSEFHDVQEIQVETASLHSGDMEREGNEDVPAVRELSSDRQAEIEAEEMYRIFSAEADVDDDELQFPVIKKLKNIKIAVPSEVPISHCVETHFTHVPTKQQREVLAELGVKLKYKKFTPAEDAVIRKNWEHFRTVYDFEDSDAFTLFGQKHFCYLKYSERKHFVQYLGSGLPHRTLYSIYGRFKVLYSHFFKGEFTEIEDDIIKHHVTKGMDRQAFSTLSKLFSRDRLSIYKRYKWLCEHCPNQGRMSWTLQKVETLTNSILKVTGSKNVEDLRDKHISLSIWREVEKDSGFVASCARDIWRSKLSTQLFCPEPIYYNQIRIKLIKRLYRDRVQWWQDIVWADIAKDFGVSPMFLWSIFRKILKSFFPERTWEHIQANFREIIKVMKKQHIATLKGKTRNYRLQRLRMGEDGKLFVLPED